MKKYSVLLLLAIFQFQQALPVQDERKSSTQPWFDLTTRSVQSLDNCCREFPTCCLPRGKKREEDDTSARMHTMFLRESADKARLKDDIELQKSIQTLLDARNEELVGSQHKEDYYNTDIESSDLRSTLQQSVSLLKREKLKESLQLLLNNLRKMEEEI